MTTTPKLSPPMTAALRQAHTEGPGSTLTGVRVATALAIEDRNLVQVDRGESGHGNPHYALSAAGYEALGLPVPNPLPTIPRVTEDDHGHTIITTDKYRIMIGQGRHDDLRGAHLARVYVDNALRAQADPELAELRRQVAALPDGERHCTRVEHGGDHPDVDALYDRMNARERVVWLQITQEILPVLRAAGCSADWDAVSGERMFFSEKAGCEMCTCSPGVVLGGAIHGGGELVTRIYVDPLTTAEPEVKPEVPAAPAADVLHHTVTLEGPDGAGHWEWRCLKPDCDAEATGYEPGEVVEEAGKHGPLAADSPLPAPDDDDDEDDPDTIQWTEIPAGQWNPGPWSDKPAVQFVLDEGRPVDPDDPDHKPLQDTLDRLARMARKADVHPETDPPHGR